MHRESRAFLRALWMFPDLGNAQAFEHLRDHVDGVRDRLLRFCGG